MGFKKNIKKKVRTGVWGPSQRGFGWQTAGTELFSFRLFSQMLQDRDLDLDKGIAGKQVMATLLGV